MFTQVKVIGRGRLGSAIHARLAERGLAAEGPEADLVLLCVPDSAIGGAAGAVPLGPWVAHMSGATPLSALAPHERRFGLHPLQTFSGHTVPSFAGCTCAIEGTPVALRMARRISRELGSVPVVLPSRRKAAYHVAAALAAGHALAVMETAVRILVKVGFPRQRAIHALLPLTRQTLANYERVGPRAAWTGPLSRGDFGVIERHLEALRPFPREYREAYDALSRLGLNVLASGGGSKKRLLEQTLARIKKPS